MEDLGNIVYIVAAIAWFAWSTYKKSQEAKKKPVATSRPQPEQRQVVEEYVDEYEDEYEEPRTFEDMILEQLGHRRPQPVKQELEKQAVEDRFSTSNAGHAHFASDYKMSVGEMKSHRMTPKTKKLEVVELEEESAIDSILPDGFDLRQAVVLNAILERPYN